MSNKNKVLSDSEIQRLKSMSLYWKEVREREDTSPLVYETVQVYRELQVKLLFLVEHYIELIELLDKRENKK